MYTDLSGSLGDATELPPAFVTAATRLHERLGAPPAGTAYEVYLCHVFCELGAVPMVDEMRTLRGFLDRHPDEVIVMVIEDYAPPDRIAAVLRDAGLEPKLLPVTDPSALPSLGDMLSSGHPLQVSLENGDGGPDAPQRLRRPGAGDAVHVPPAPRPRAPRRRAAPTAAPTVRPSSSSTTGSRPRNRSPRGA